MLGKLAMIDADGNRRYLLDKTQHLVGGFGKGVGEPPGEQKTSFLLCFV
jgi:geranylgeranyl transferase type-1 subunit beta